MKLDIRRHTVWSLTDDLAQQCGGIMFEAFRPNNGNMFIKGPCETPAEYWPVAYQSIRNPLTRLDAMSFHMKKQRVLVADYTRRVKSLSLKPGSVVYTAHDEDGRVVGFSGWEYPKHLAIRRECGQVGICYQVYRLWYKIKCKVADWWDQFSQLHPLDPQRERTYRQIIHDAYEPALTGSGLYVDEKTIGSFESLDDVNAHYQRKDTVYLQLLAILPECQGKGVGTRLLRQNIDGIPNVPTPISYGGVQLLGPQKFSLTATQEAIPLYERLGFKTYAKSVTEFCGTPHIRSKMEMVRPAQAVLDVQPFLETV